MDDVAAFGAAPRLTAQIAACREFSGFCACGDGRQTDCEENALSRAVDAALAAFQGPVVIGEDGEQEIGSVAA